MLGYLVKRVLLLPLTLFCIVFINFLIINLAPGEPVYVSDIGAGGQASRRASQNMAGADERYLQFREFFGLTLPIFYNDWPLITKKMALSSIEALRTKRKGPTGGELSAEEQASLRISLGDQARFILPQLITLAQDNTLGFETRRIALHFILRGATRFLIIGSSLSPEEKQENSTIRQNNLFLDAFRLHQPQNLQELNEQVERIAYWYKMNPEGLTFAKEGTAYMKTALFETRFAKYMKRTLSLDFGVLRQDPNRSVISEVASRLKISLTLSILPMVVTCILCLFFGMLMAIFSKSLFDNLSNLLFLILWATPVFVVAPFLIEKVALYHDYPMTHLPFPIRGFSSEESLYSQMTSWQRLLDIGMHITLPLVTIFIASFAVQTRLSRAVFLDVMSHDYIKTAKAKGAGVIALYCKHVGRNASIPIITSVAGSLGLILGGSVIIETIFEIHGFGKFFYDAILNRDYNVMMFSSLVGSFLALIGYLVADIAYMMLDPRVQLGSEPGARS